MNGAWITGYGAVTPLGGNTAQSCAALRAGLARFRPTDRHLCRPADENDPDMEAPIVSAVDEIEPEAEGSERLLLLALPALGDALHSAGMRRSDLAAAVLFLVLPARSRPDPPPDPAVFARELFRRAALPGPESVTAVREGHSGFAAAAEAVLARFDGGARGPAIVLAVDSLLDRRLLRALDAEDRLKCTRSPEGFVPGEAAGAIVLRSPAAARDGREKASLLAVGRAQEAATVRSDHACTGEGLSAAIRAAALSLGTPPSPPWVIVDHNGERYRALEWGYAVTRCHELFPALRHTWYLADCLGDVGAATGTLAACRAAAAFERGYAPGPAAFVVLGSDDGDRGAVVLGGPPPSER
jgi:3-oxoacyl-[acyl-carrier-protein] synthase I